MLDGDDSDEIPMVLRLGGVRTERRRHKRSSNPFKSGVRNFSLPSLIEVDQDEDGSVDTLSVGDDSSASSIAPGDSVICVDGESFLRRRGDLMCCRVLE